MVHSQFITWHLGIQILIFNRDYLKFNKDVSSPVITRQCTFYQTLTALSFFQETQELILECVGSREARTQSSECQEGSSSFHGDESYDSCRTNKPNNKPQRVAGADARQEAERWPACQGAPRGLHSGRRKQNCWNRGSRGTRGRHAVDVGDTSTCRE